MKIVLATGIYPPEIGGPATYAQALAAALQKRGEDVTVITYGPKQAGNIILVPRDGGPVFRWWRYAKALRAHAADADVIIAFSSVSVGVPLALAGLKNPKKILRLGGDFFWERYTDRGGVKGLREWYGSTHYSLLTTHWFMRWLLRTFDHIVFSTRFQEETYEQHYKNLPPHSVIENALPNVPVLAPAHALHHPFRLLFMGRFVGFKNLLTLVVALKNEYGRATLTLVGEGPVERSLRFLVEKLQLQSIVTFSPPAHGTEKQELFAEHDLLVLPSKTEISPNVALEARATGLPVLLTKETGLSSALSQGMILRDLSTVQEIVAAIEEVEEEYDGYAASAASPPPKRSWNDVAEEFLILSRT